MASKEEGKTKILKKPNIFERRLQMIDEAAGWSTPRQPAKARPDKNRSDKKKRRANNQKPLEY